MSKHYSESQGLHLNYSIITSLIPNKSNVLDVGCGDGTLMKMLQEKNVHVCGIDINQDNIVKCLEKGLSVIQGDIDEGLHGYPDKSYDYVVLNKTLLSNKQSLENLLKLFSQLLAFPE